MRKNILLKFLLALAPIFALSSCSNIKPNINQNTEENNGENDSNKDDNEGDNASPDNGENEGEESPYINNGEDENKEPEAVYYSVNFYSEDKLFCPEVKVLENTKVKDPGIPAYSNGNLVFSHWETESKVKWNFENKITSNLNLYATFFETSDFEFKFTSIFNDIDPNLVTLNASKETYKIGETVTLTLNIKDNEPIYDLIDLYLNDEELTPIVKEACKTFEFKFKFYKVDSYNLVSNFKKVGYRNVYYYSLFDYPPYPFNSELDSNSNSHSFLTNGIRKQEIYIGGDFYAPEHAFIKSIEGDYANENPDIKNKITLNKEINIVGSNRFVHYFLNFDLRGIKFETSTTIKKFKINFGGFLFDDRVPSSQFLNVILINELEPSNYFGKYETKNDNGVKLNFTKDYVEITNFNFVLTSEINPKETLTLNSAKIELKSPMFAPNYYYLDFKYDIYYLNTFSYSFKLEISINPFNDTLYVNFIISSQDYYGNSEDHYIVGDIDYNDDYVFEQFKKVN